MDLRQTAQHEEVQRQKIEYHRKVHADRLARIMDERHREIGLEMNELKQQAEERRAREAAERDDEKAYQRRFLEEQRVLGRMVREEQKIRSQIIKDDIKFHREFQQPEQAREYDIWRPDYVSAQPPVRSGDNDPWLGISSGQKFEGEDLTGDDRRKRQNEQLVRWQTQQKKEDEHKRACELAEQREWERRYIENDRRMQELEEAKRQARIAVQQRQDDENFRAMNEKRRQRGEERNDELESNEWEKMETLNSAFMSESRGQAVGRGGKRIVQDWKGFTDQETKQTREDRETQALGNSMRRAEEAAKERREEAERMRATRDALRMERAKERERAQQRRALAEEYQLEAEAHKEHEDVMNKDVYGSNQPQEDFWKGFSRSHR